MSWPVELASVVQSGMIHRFDLKKKKHSMFQAGERVLIFLPVVGSGLEAKFCGHYKVERH